MAGMVGSVLEMDDEFGVITGFWGAGADALSIPFGYRCAALRHTSSRHHASSRSGSPLDQRVLKFSRLATML